MRYFTLLLFVVCSFSFADVMTSLNPGDYQRQRIVEDLRREEAMPDRLFSIKRIASNGDVVYICALVQDKQNNYMVDKNNKYHLYDRIMLETDNGWISAVRLDRKVDGPEVARCFYQPGKDLYSEMLKLRVEKEGRKNLCQPVHRDDPLRQEILKGIRANYIGDTNILTLNGALPTVRFVVEDLCASETHAYFYGGTHGERQSEYTDPEHGENLEVVLQKASDGAWYPLPENQLLTQQSRILSRQYERRFTAAMLEDIAQNLSQRCALEGDSISVTGVLEEVKNAGAVYWIVKTDKLPRCVRDADSQKTGWNSQLQLLLTTEEQETLKDLLGKPVIVGGDILLALSAQHHTPLLLDNIFLLKEAR